MARVETKDLFLMGGSLGAVAAGAATWAVWRLHQKGLLHPPHEFSDSKTALVGEHSIHYVQMGKGPHLVLLHGIGASIYPWRKIIPELAKHFTVTAMDLPGFGRSTKNPALEYGLDEQADRLAEFLTKVGVDQATLVGNSMGGAIALWMAKKYPARFDKLVALAPAVGPRFEALTAHFAHPMAKPLQWLTNPITIARIYRRVTAKEENIHNEAIHTYLHPYINDPNAGLTFLKAAKTVLRDKRLPDELKDLSSHVLILWGERDQLVPKKFVDRLHEVLPSSQLVLHPEAGHHSMEDEPEWVVDQIRDFVSKQNS